MRRLQPRGPGYAAHIHGNAKAARWIAGLRTAEVVRYLRAQGVTGRITLSFGVGYAPGHGHAIAPQRHVDVIQRSA